MIKEIIVAGIKLHNYSVLENLTQIAKNLEANVFTTIGEVYMKTVLLAKEDESVKESLESLDVTVIAEVGILDAVGQATILRRAEIERREFFFQLMKILERNGHTVCILGDDSVEVETVGQYLAEEFPRMKVVGSQVLELVSETEDKVINDMNMLAPDVILSVLSSPVQEHFLKKHKPMLLAKIWYGVGSQRIVGTRLTFSARVKKFLGKHMFKRYVEQQVQSEQTVEVEKEREE